MSYDQLDKNDPVDSQAHTLLVRIAHFAHGEWIPRYLIRAVMKIPENDFDAIMGAEDALLRLSELGLIEFGSEGAVRLHRLVAMAILETIDYQERSEAQEVVEEIIIADAHRLNETYTPLEMQPIRSHLRVITDAAKDREDVRAAALCYEFERFLWMMGEYKKAQVYVERSLKIREHILGINHPDTATVLNGLAVLLHEQGEYEAARMHYERALEIWSKIPGSDIYTAKALDNLGNLFSEVFHQEEAQPYYERAIEIQERLLGLEHPATASSINNLGAHLHTLEKYDEAHRLYDQAQQIYTQVYGIDHPDTARVIRNLAELLSDRGEYEQALALFQKAHNIYERQLGLEHPEIAELLYFQAICLFRQGEHYSAAQTMKRVLSIREKTLGLEHPDTQLARHQIEKFDLSPL
jgi:tetratricopeptide (TPR) repeat protein